MLSYYSTYACEYGKSRFFRTLAVLKKGDAPSSHHGPFCSGGLNLIIIIWSRKKKRNRCDLKKINYNKVNNTFLLQFQRSVLVLFAQGVSVHGVSVLRDMCPGGKCPGGIIPAGICPRG